jgi:hypothetical protein
MAFDREPEDKSTNKLNVYIREYVSANFSAMKTRGYIHYLSLCHASIALLPRCIVRSPHKADTAGSILASFIYLNTG